MKFLLVEELSEQARTFIAQLNPPKDVTKKFLTKDYSNIQTIEPLLQFMESNKLNSKLLELATLSDRDATFKDYQKDILLACIKLLYPNICQSPYNCRALVDSAIQDGYSTTDNTFMFQNKDVEYLVSNIEDLRTKSPETKNNFLSYMLTNRANGKLTSKDIQYIVKQFPYQFNENTSSDMKYKLDVYIWLKNAYNLERYGIDKTFNWATTTVREGSKQTNVEGGVTLGEMSATDIRRWLNQFEQKEDTESLLIYLKDRNIPTFKDFLAKYAPQIQKIDSTGRYDEIVKKLNKLDNDGKIESFFSGIYVPKTGDVRDVYKAIINKLDMQSGFGKQKRVRTNTATENGITAMRKILKLEKNKMTPSDMKNYIEKVARDNHLVANFKRWTRNLDQVRLALDTQITYDKRIDDGLKFALDNHIIYLLKLA